MNYFISLGLFALIEKLRLITLRNFIQRIYMIVKETPELQLNGRQNLLNLNLVYLPLCKQWDQDLEMDELECYIASLIKERLI